MNRLLKKNYINAKKIAKDGIEKTVLKTEEDAIEKELKDRLKSMKDGFTHIEGHDKLYVTKEEIQKVQDELNMI